MELGPDPAGTLAHNTVLNRPAPLRPASSSTPGTAGRWLENQDFSFALTSPAGLVILSFSSTVTRGTILGCEPRFDGFHRDTSALKTDFQG